MHTSSAFCVICTILTASQFQAKADCIHVFRPLIIRAQHMGIMCDLSGGDHQAVIHAASKVSVCDLCHTVSCFVCLSQ